MMTARDCLQKAYNLECRSRKMMSDANDLAQAAQLWRVLAGAARSPVVQTEAIATRLGEVSSPEEEVGVYSR